MGAWGDYDGDGDLDLLLAGCSTGDNLCDGKGLARIYRNDGSAANRLPAAPTGLGAVVSPTAARLS